MELETEPPLARQDKGGVVRSQRARAYARSAAAEKSVEGTALKTRLGARQIGADHTFHPVLATTLFGTESYAL